MIFLRTGHNYDRELVSMETGLSIDKTERVTQQQFKEESDINTIVKRFGLTGQVPTSFKPPMSGDFTGVEDYQTALNALIEADKQFMELPAAVRKRFENDPQKLLEFMEDVMVNEGAMAEARTLGLVNPVPERTRDVVQAVDELAAKMVAK